MLNAPPATRSASIVLTIVALVWAGMVIGVSALATPVKFQAPSLSLPVALEVGHVTFRAFSRVEWLLAALLVLSGAVAGLRRPLLWLPIGFVAAIVAAQAFWLLPVLDTRIAAVIGGAPLPASSDHLYYVIAEGVKLVALLTIGISAIGLSMGSRRR